MGNSEFYVPPTDFFQKSKGETPLLFCSYKQPELSALHFTCYCNRCIKMEFYLEGKVLFSCFCIS